MSDDEHHSSELLSPEIANVKTDESAVMTTETKNIERCRILELSEIIWSIIGSYSDVVAPSLVLGIAFPVFTKTIVDANVRVDGTVVRGMFLLKKACRYRVPSAAKLIVDVYRLNVLGDRLDVLRVFKKCCTRGDLIMAKCLANECFRMNFVEDEAQRKLNLFEKCCLKGRIDVADWFLERFDIYASRSPADFNRLMRMCCLRGRMSAPDKYRNTLYLWPPPNRVREAVDVAIRCFMDGMIREGQWMVVHHKMTVLDTESPIWTNILVCCCISGAKVSTLKWIATNMAATEDQISARDNLALRCCCAFGRFEIAQWLLNECGLAKKIDDSKMTEMLVQCLAFGHLELAQLVLESVRPCALADPKFAVDLMKNYRVEYAVIVKWLAEFLNCKYVKRTSYGSIRPWYVRKLPDGSSDRHHRSMQWILDRSTNTEELSRFDVQLICFSKRTSNGMLRSNAIIDLFKTLTNRFDCDALLDHDFEFGVQRCYAHISNEMMLLIESQFGGETKKAGRFTTTPSDP